MQTDISVFQDLNNGFFGVVEKGKSIKALEKTGNSAVEEGAFLSAFTGLLNRHGEDIKMLDEALIKDEPNDFEINENETGASDYVFSVSGFSELEISVTDQPEKTDFSGNKTELTDKIESVRIESVKIESVKNFESVDITDSKSGFLITPSDVEDTDLAIKNNGAQADRIKLGKIGTDTTDTSEKTNIKIINKPPELLHLKNGYEISPGEKVLPETSGQPQAAAGTGVVKKDMANQDQIIKKDDLTFLQKKETPFAEFDQRFGDQSGSREAFNRKELFSKLESKAPAQNGFNKAPLQVQEGCGANFTSGASPKIAEPVFTQIEDLKNKDLNISKIQVGGENKDTAHIAFKSHFSEQSAGAVKGDEPAQKPAAAEVVSQIIDKAALTLRKGQNEMRISLKPDSLGRLNLKIVTDNHHVMVKIMADNPYVKELIEHNLHHLKAELGSQGLQIDKFDVFVADDSYRNGEREGNNQFFKMKNRKNAGRNS
ncbi:MAG: flagellar hook-length control protein FliK, partial [Desulfosarcina sp.]|nr:flagellar hook-length control protein FliK [Desulfobacterales bacterium]